jgi:hypothetical protein
LVSICLSAASALAGCAEDVIAAWKRLQDSPFSFAMRTSNELPLGLSISGAVHWKGTGLHYLSDLPRGKFKVRSAGGRDWSFFDGKWHDESITFDGPTTHVITTYAELFGLHSDLLAHRLHDAKCLGRVMKDGRELVGYEYRVDKALFLGAVVITHEKLYADPATGMPARQELEGSANGAAWRAETEIRLEASLKIEPPSLFQSEAQK